ncbi:M18 family aminopeptidase [Actinoallomurus acaciae]|uniref:Probable M18 family aminopeptidase 2 n=1 Tax=Actinoallomurus acaciae TaxID=502577 RepID=A0ABV5YBB6_9ACTN
MSTQLHFQREHTDDLASFITAGPSPYHVVANVAERLEKAGFTRLGETDAWDGESGGRYVIRGGAIIAWFVPEGAPPETPFRIIGAHTDSPNLRVKPRPDAGAYGWRQVAVEIYGGPLLNSWLDRDLGLSGRLVLRDGGTRLLAVDRPLLRVPQLAIHLDRNVNDKGLVLDRQRHMQPIWGLGAVDEGGLIRFAAETAGVEASDVVGWDLMTHDVQPPAYLGRDQEFLAAARLDDQLSVHAATAALTAAAGSSGPSHVPVLAAFDHEENGSESDSGAGGPLLGRVLERSVFVRGGSYEDRARALAGSVCVSADTGHAVHPNYADRHDPTHRPMPGGPILKVNVNQRYATDGVGRGIFTEACDRAGVPLQEFVSSNAMPCGTTIGPITAARYGITTVDVGVPILSMHSARELCGADDPFLLANALKAFLED